MICGYARTLRIVDLGLLAQDLLKIVELGLVRIISVFVEVLLYPLLHSLVLLHRFLGEVLCATHTHHLLVLHHDDFKV